MCDIMFVMSDLERSLLEAALIGLESQRTHIEEQIASVRSMIDGRRNEPRAVVKDSKPAARKRRKMSAAAISRIRAGQKKRWAEFRAAKQSASKKAESD